jgi:hypothetical protein
MVEMITLFIVLQLVNVVLQTLKSIITVKGTTTQSALMNAIAYGVYTVIVVFTAGEFTGNYITDLIIKIVVTMGTNLIGVYISAWILNKFKKDKLWEIVATVDQDVSIYAVDLTEMKLKENNISYNVTQTQNQNEYVFHIYSKSQTESQIIKTILNEWKAKYIVHEESVKL